MEEDRIDKEGKGDKIGDFTRDYADVIGRNQIRGSKMAVQKLALLAQRNYFLAAVDCKKITSR